MQNDKPLINGLQNWLQIWEEELNSLSHAIYKTES